MTDSFRKILLQGQYFYYQLAPSATNDMAFLDTLTIQLENIVGDADLVVSTTNILPKVDSPAASDLFYQQSRQTDRFDSITLRRADNFTLNRTVYIGVYASSMAVYQLTFKATYANSFNIRLTRATPLNESQALSIMYLQESQESLLSFTPWWSAAEQRYVVLYADVTFNKIFFYAQKNDFPQFYTTDLTDKNDIVSINPSKYTVKDTYYIRTRPEFAMYDLISKREYIFNFYAFSLMQTRRDSGLFIDLHVNESQMGYASNQD